MNLTFGVIGVGQAGNKLADSFAAADLPSIAANTAPQDLDALKNIPEDRRIHTKINEGGGAGKDIRLGEIAIKKYEDQIAKMIELALGKTDFIFVQGGLGGGSGTLGITGVVRILSKMGRKHGIIATLPTKSEGTYEKVNAAAGVYMIEQARQKFQKNLRPVSLIDNDLLKDLVLKNSDASYEKTWERANEYIRDSFMDMYELSQVSGDHNFDTTDYLKNFDIPGYMVFGKTVIDNFKNKSDTILTQVAENSWKDSFFVGGEVSKQAKGAAVLVNRPSNFNDGGKIHQLFDDMKNHFGAIHFCPGVYSTDNKIKIFAEKVGSKPVEIYTLLAGLPFPAARLNQLSKEAKSEQEQLTVHKETATFDFDPDIVKSIIDTGPEKEVDDDFGFFGEDLKVDKLDWNHLKEVD